MSFVERSNILCPKLGGSTVGGSTVKDSNKHMLKKPEYTT